MDLEVLPLIMLRKKALVAKPPKKAAAGPLPAMGDEVVTEFTANEGKLDPTMNPTFTMMDKDGSNSVDQDEWSAEDGHRQGLQGVRQILVPVPEQS